MDRLTTEHIIKLSMQGDREAISQLNKIDKALDRLSSRRGATDIELAAYKRVHNAFLGAAGRYTAQAMGEHLGIAPTITQRMTAWMKGEVASRPPTFTERVFGAMRGKRITEEGRERRLFGDYPLIPKMLMTSYAIKIAAQYLTDFTRAGIHVKTVEDAFTGVSGGVEEANERLKTFGDLLKIVPRTAGLEFLAQLKGADVRKWTGEGAGGPVSEEKIAEAAQWLVRLGRLRNLLPEDVLHKFLGGITTGQSAIIGEIIPGYRPEQTRQQIMEEEGLREGDLDAPGRIALNTKVMLAAIMEFVGKLSEQGRASLIASDKLAGLPIIFQNLRDQTILTITATKEYEKALEGIANAATKLAPKVASAATSALEFAESGPGQAVLGAGLATYAAGLAYKHPIGAITVAAAAGAAKTHEDVSSMDRYVALQEKLEAMNVFRAQNMSKMLANESYEAIAAFKLAMYELVNEINAVRAAIGMGGLLPAARMP